MIEEPPLLTIKRPSRRPTPEQIAAFQNVPTSFVVDALQGGHTLSPNIRPLGEGRDLPTSAVGPALTVDNGPADILALLASLKFIQDGDILVTGANGYQGCAAMGDRVAGFIKNNGACAIVTDGPARDYAGIVEVGIPIWCTGLNPNTPFGKGPGKVGFPIQFGGQQIETGDLIVADFDGVVVVPFDRIEEVIRTLKTIVELETALDSEVRGGLKIPPAIEELLQSDQVKMVE